MKITIPLISRNRPTGLLSVLTSLDALATGSHEITYVLIIDDDDELTLAMLRDYAKYLPVTTVVRAGKRDRTLTVRMNQAINEFPADLYTFLPDDGYPLCQHWDAIFDQLKVIPAFAWRELNDPENATFICLSERWRKATGKGLSEHFAFWFADTWIMEVHLLAFAEPISIVPQLSMGGKRGKTQGMRDLPFWFDFFARTRVERIREAEKVAREWGYTVDVLRDRREQLEFLEQCDRNQLTRIKDYERIFNADRGEPSEVYKQVKAKAEAWRA